MQTHTKNEATGNEATDAEIEAAQLAAYQDRQANLPQVRRARGDVATPAPTREERAKAARQAKAAEEDAVAASAALARTPQALAAARLANAPNSSMRAQHAATVSRGFAKIDRLVAASRLAEMDLEEAYERVDALSEQLIAARDDGARQRIATERAKAEIDSEVASAKSRAATLAVDLEREEMKAPDDGTITPYMQRVEVEAELGPLTTPEKIEASTKPARKRVADTARAFLAAVAEMNKTATEANEWIDRFNAAQDGLERICVPRERVSLRDPIDLLTTVIDATETKEK